MGGQSSRADNIQRSLILQGARNPSGHHGTQEQQGRQPVLSRWDLKDVGGEGCHHRAEGVMHLEAGP